MHRIRLCGGGWSRQAAYLDTSAIPLSLCRSFRSINSTY